MRSSTKFLVTVALICLACGCSSLSSRHAPHRDQLVDDEKRSVLVEPYAVASAEWDW